MKRRKIQKIVKKIIDRTTEMLDNVSLLNKFVLIFIICVVLPVLLSWSIFTVSTNRYFYEREMTNMNNALQIVSEDIQNGVEEAVVMTNVIANDREIRDIASRRFESELDYYENMIDKKLKDNYDIYFTQKDYIENIAVYVNNDTVSNGGIIWKIDDNLRREGWYKRCSENTKMTTVCTYTYVNTKNFDAEHPAKEQGTISVIRRFSGDITGRALLGYIKVDINMETVRKHMLRNKGYIDMYLLNYDENLVYDPKTNEFTEGTETFFKNKDRKHIILESSFGNTSYLEQWKLCGLYDQGRITQKQVINAITVLLITLVIGAVMMMLIILIYRSYQRRISKMIQSMKCVENGKFREINMKAGSDEIGVLTDTYNHMVNTINSLINDVYKLEINNKSMEAEKAKAELKLLQSQVDPHFIFNVLNAMLVVSIKKGYTDLAEQISGLAKMFRRLLDWSEDYEPLSTEISFVETYLKLEKFRFAEQFSYEIDVDDAAGKCGIPKMIVQPLVENACRHGLQGITGKRYLYVGTHFADGVLEIKVKDNGKGINKDKLEELNYGLENGEFEGHIGLKNVYRRLKIYYGNNASMKIKSVENEGTEITIRIEYESEEQDV